MSIISFVRGMLLIGLGAVWLLNVVCMLMRIIANFYIILVSYRNFTKDPISYVFIADSVLSSTANATLSLNLNNYV